VIEPASYDITVYQNATWKTVFRATLDRQTITDVDIATTLFTVPCHGLVANDKVVFTEATGASLPCGMTPNTIYYVISTGLTNDAFKISATSGGAALTLHGTTTGTLYVAEPMNLTGYVVDADIKGLLDGASIGTFTPTITDAANGAFELVLTPATTVAFAVGRYGYDVSLTSSGGERYYWLTGVLTVEKTYSRT
jgi:hypothetical protein